jgi:uracil-DNA glycosylase family 4
MTDSRAHIIQDLQRWARQQGESGVTDFVFDVSVVEAAREAVFAKAIAEDGAPPATVAAAQDDPEARQSKAAQLAELDTKQVSVCTKCPLHTSRTNTVFGVGNPDSDVVFVGEAPGRDEDLKGEPFVGRAGQLLNKILEAVGFQREDVYIANILKCRPPENRNPSPTEIQACQGFLERQIDELEPGLLVALGLFAAQWLTGKKLSLTKLRETGPYAYRGIPVHATYHPAALLRNPGWKRPAWEDFKIIREEYEKL